MFKLLTFSQAEDPRYQVEVIRPGSPYSVMDKVANGDLVPSVAQFIDAAQAVPGHTQVLLCAMGAGEWYSCNSNADRFREAGLVNAPGNWAGMALEEQRQVGAGWAAQGGYGFPTFYGACPFVHHKNKDPNRALGRVVLAAYNPAMHRVELVVDLAHDKCSEFGGDHVIQQLEHGERPAVSMGARVKFDFATCCGDREKYEHARSLFNPDEHPAPDYAILEYHKKDPIRGLARTRHEYCECFLRDRGKILPSGIKVCVDNDYPRFFDISFVLIGADKIGTTLMKVASPTYSLPLSSEEAEKVGWVEDTTTECGSACQLWGSELQKVASGDMLEFKHWKGEGKTDEEADHLAGEGMLMKGEPTDEAVDRELRAMRMQERRNMRKAAFPQFDFFSLPEEDKRRLLAEDREERIAWEKAAGAKDVLDYGVLSHVPGTAAHVTRLAEGGPQSLADAVHGVVKPPVGDSAGLAQRLSHLLGRGDFGVQKGVFTKEGVSVPDGMTFEELREYQKPKPGEFRGVKVPKNLKLGPPPPRNRKEFPFVGTVKFRGLTICVENPAGSVRRGKGWKTLMKHHYGEIVGSKGTDGDKLDVYVGPHKSAPSAFVVHQNFVGGKRDGKYDEDKVMLGFNSSEEAKRAYLEHYDSPKFFRSITEMPFRSFKVMIMGEVRGEKVASAWVGDPKLAMDLSTYGLERIEHDDDVQLDPVCTSDWDPYDDDKTAELAKRVAAPMLDRVSEVAAAEPDIPDDILNELGEKGDLCTPSAMGMVLKPREFQRIILMNRGQGGLADAADDENVTFRMGQKDAPDAPFPVLGQILPELKKLLMPLMEDRCSFAPPMKRRVLRIIITKSMPEEHHEAHEEPQEVDHPELDKVSAMYTAYRRGLIHSFDKLANQALGDEEIAREVLGDDSLLDAFSGEKVANAGQIATALFPAIFLYTAHLQHKMRKGEDLNLIQRVMGGNPVVAASLLRGGLSHLLSGGRG